MTIPRWLLLCCIGLVTACASKDAGPRPAAVILPGSAAKSLLNQCSRSAPSLGEATWQPGWTDIAALEALLPQALAADPRARGLDTANAPRGWHRQYVGITRNGRQFIYGSFFPDRAMSRMKGWDAGPVMICDGGPAFFGVELDVQARRISHLDFNGDFASKF